MSAINLAGLQSLDVPPSLFDEFFDKSSHFGASKYPEGREVYVDIRHDVENKYQTEDEPALGVYLDECLIGWIPVLSTIERYINETAALMGKAMTEMNADEHIRLQRKWHKESERYGYASDIRDCIMTDLYRNSLPSVKGELTRVQIGDNGKVLSVSVFVDTP
jgi:hypothetical protein